MWSLTQAGNARFVSGTPAIDVLASSPLVRAVETAEIVAGAYGAVTVSRRILFVQALPALVAFVLVLLGD